MVGQRRGGKGEGDRCERVRYMGEMRERTSESYERRVRRALRERRESRYRRERERERERDARR